MGAIRRSGGRSWLATLVAVLAAFTLIAAACGDDEEPAPAPAPAAPAVDTAALEAAQADAAAALAEASAAAEAAAEAEAALEAALAEAMAAAEGQVDPEAVAAIEAQLEEAQAAAEAAEAEAMAAAAEAEEATAAAEAAQAEAAEAAATAEEAAAGPTDPCGGENETSTNTIMMDWLAYWSWAALVAADDQGYYAEEGLKVDIIAPPSAAEPLKMLAADQVDFAINYVPALFTARAAGIDVKAVAAHQRNLSASLFWLPDAGIEGPQDFRGKTIGATAKLDENAYLDTLLEREGMTRDDITIVDPGFSWAPLLLEGSIDVAYGVAPSPASMKGIGGPFDLVRLEYRDYGVPNYPWLLFVSSDAFINANPAATCRFLRATDRGIAYAYSDDATTEAMANMLHGINDGFAVQTNIDHSGLMRADFFDENGQWGKLVEADWEAGRAWLVERGLLEADSTVQVSDVMTNEYITRALAPQE